MMDGGGRQWGSQGASEPLTTFQLLEWLSGHLLYTTAYLPECARRPLITQRCFRSCGLGNKPVLVPSCQTQQLQEALATSKSSTPSCSGRDSAPAHLPAPRIRPPLPLAYTRANNRELQMGVSSFTSTFDLVERFRAGDETAFGQLFAAYRPRLAVLIRYKLGERLRERVEVDDILQEVFLAASKDIGSFTYRCPGSFMSWLSRIADHLVADEARSQARQKRRAVELVRFRSASNPDGPEPADPT